MSIFHQNISNNIIENENCMKIKAYYLDCKSKNIAEDIQNIKNSSIM
jgi:hypothetical protein